MQTWEAITSRRNVRLFAERRIPAADLDRILEAGRRSPDWALLISLGYPADRPLTPIKNPDRRPFDDVVHRGHW